MSIFPFISPANLQTSNAAELPVFREYAYDFENNALLLKNGNTYLLEGNEALHIWIYKAINTVRYSYIAYSSDYGCEVLTLIGSVISNEILTSEIKRFIIEAVMVNPYIKELNNFTFYKSASKITVNFDCLSIYGMTGISIDLKGG